MRWSINELDGCYLRGMMASSSANGVVGGI